MTKFLGFKYLMCNVNWNLTDTHRPLFLNDTAWNNFSDEMESKYGEFKSFTPADVDGINMSFSINLTQLPVHDINNAQNYNYCLVQIDNEYFGYFVVSYDITNVSNLSYNLKIDSISSYLRRFSYGKSCYIERKHCDRYLNEKDENGDYLINNWYFRQNIDPLTENIKPSFSNTKIDMTLTPPIYNLDTKIPDPEYYVDVFSTNSKWFKALNFSGNSQYPLFATAVLNTSINLKDEQDNIFDDVGIFYAPLINSDFYFELRKDNNLGIDWDNYSEKYGLVREKPTPAGKVDFDNVNDYIGINGSKWSAYIKTIMITNYPLWTGNIKLQTIKFQDKDKIENSIGVLNTELFTNNQFSFIGSTAFKFKTIDNAFNIKSLKNLILDFIDVKTITLNRYYDPKILSQEFIKIEIQDINKQKFIINQNLYDLNKELWFDYSFGIFGNEALHYLSYSNKSNITKNNYLYQVPFYESGLLSVSQNSLPNTSSAYNTFLINSGSAYSTAKQNINRNYKFNELNAGIQVSSVIPKIATGKINNSVNGSKNGVLSGIGAEITRKNQLNSLNANMNDLKRQPENVNLQGIQGTALNFMVNKTFSTTTTTTNWGNYRMLISTPYQQPLQQLDNHFFKNGYIINNNETLIDINYLKVRQVFNFWKIIDFCNAIDKSITGISQKVYDDIDEIFKNGITLWNDYKNINNYSIGNKELWMSEGD